MTGFVVVVVVDDGELGQRNKNNDDDEMLNASLKTYKFSMALKFHSISFYSKRQ